MRSHDWSTFKRNRSIAQRRSFGLAADDPNVFRHLFNPMKQDGRTVEIAF
jgi:hypothetical protein